MSNKGNTVVSILILILGAVFIYFFDGDQLPRSIVFLCGLAFAIPAVMLLVSTFFTGKSKHSAAYRGIQIVCGVGGLGLGACIILMPDIFRPLLLYPFAALLVVEKVNGAEAVENPQRLNFDQMTPVYPNKRVVLEAPDGSSSMLIRLVDLIAPIGFGQRAMIVSPPGSDSLSILRDIGCAIKRNDENAEVLMLLIDVAPEEVTEIRESAAGEVFASTFADSPEMQTRVSETMLERAERQVESGKNVVILLDSLTKLTRAYQGTLVQGSRPMSNTVTPAALVRPKRFFGAARNTREGGSLTVVATININTGSRVDDIIYEEFKGTANMELYLLSPSDSDPIHPMINLQRCGTKKDDMLLDEARKESLRSIRKVLGSATNGEAVVQLIDMMKKTKCNEDLMARLKEWVALWEKSGYLKK